MAMVAAPAVQVDRGGFPVDERAAEEQHQAQSSRLSGTRTKPPSMGE
jgi:hypothetical protein